MELTDLAGTWIPKYRQATFDVTPFHEVKENTMATIVINEDGISGHMERRKMFGRIAREEIVIAMTGDPNMAIIMQPETRVMMLAMIDEDGKLVTKWDAPMKSLNDMCVVYERK